MDFLNSYWGVNDNISPLELAARAFVMFWILFFMVRLSGMRPFRHHNTFDTVIAVLMGGILSRGVVGATPFFSTVAGGLVIMLVNRVIAFVCFRFKKMEKLVNGEKFKLFENSVFMKQNLAKTEITEKEMHEELRIKCQLDSFKGIDKAYLETTGDISFVKKSDDV